MGRSFAALVKQQEGAVSSCRVRDGGPGQKLTLGHTLKSRLLKHFLTLCFLEWIWLHTPRWRSGSNVDSGAHTEISPPETLFDTVFPWVKMTAYSKLEVRVKWWLSSTHLVLCCIWKTFLCFVPSSKTYIPSTSISTLEHGIFMISQETHLGILRWGRTSGRPVSNTVSDSESVRGVIVWKIFASCLQECLWRRGEEQGRRCR